MRSEKYSKDKFFIRMKKKPEQQRVLDNLDNYSVEDIHALTTPHFPMWIKEALIALKDKVISDAENARANTAADDIAAKMNEYSRKQLNKAVVKE